VAPQGQYSVFNGLAGERVLFRLQAGRFPYPGAEEEERELLADLERFFGTL